MITTEQVLRRFEHLKTYYKGLKRQPDTTEVWRSEDDGVKFIVLKYAGRKETKLRDFTGIKLELDGDREAKERVLHVFRSVLGKPSKEKPRLFGKVPKVVVWRNPRLRQ